MEIEEPKYEETTPVPTNDHLQDIENDLMI